MPLTACHEQEFIFSVLKAASPASRWWQVWFLLRPLCLAHRWSPSCYLFTRSPVCVFCVLIYSYVGLGPTHMTSFFLDYLFKGPISKYSHSLRSSGLGLQPMNLRGWGGANSAHFWGRRSMYYIYYWQSLEISQQLTSQKTIAHLHLLILLIICMFLLQMKQTICFLCDFLGF